MRINYQQAIAESVEELAAQERKLRGRRTEVRAHMLRLLKSGEVPSLAQCAPLLGYSQTQLTRWWEQYRKQGLHGVLTEAPPHGKPGKLTAEALAGLEGVMRAGKIATLRDAQRYLQEQWAIIYPSLNGVWYQLRQHRIKLKTGRRRHKKADRKAQEAFKAGFRGGPAGAGSRAGLGV